MQASQTMTDYLTDIEEVVESLDGSICIKGGKLVMAGSAIDTSFRMGETQHTSYTDASSKDGNTSKSAGSFALTVDPSVLRLVSKINDDLDSVYLGSDDSSEGRRRKDFCYGFCCDLIRAVIAIDMFYICQKLQVIVTILLGLSVVPGDFDRWYYDDDSMMTVELDRQNIMYYTLLTKNALAILFASIGIYGASTFKKYLVLTTGIWCCIELVLSGFLSRWIAVISLAVYIYPHIALFVALHRGRISKENYRDVKHCCFVDKTNFCCTDKHCCSWVDPEDEERSDETATTASKVTHKATTSKKT
jgi:hypothetical protein